MSQLTATLHPNTPEPGSAEWLMYITASKAATILGLAPKKWGTKYSLYHQMRGTFPVQAENSSMSRGRIFEPIIANAFAAENPHLEVQRTGMWVHNDRTWQAATPDRLIVDANGEVSGLEVKTARDLREWGDSIPLHYLCQIQFQMDVIGYRRTYLAVCGAFEMFDLKPKVYVIDYDPGDAKLIRRLCQEFQSEVALGIEPNPNHASDADRLALRYANTSIVDDPGVDVPAEIAVPYLEAFAAEAAVVLEKKRTGSVLLEYLGSSKKATFNGHTIASRVNSKGAPSIRATSGLAEKAPEILKPRKAEAA